MKKGFLLLILFAFFIKASFAQVYTYTNATSGAYSSIAANMTATGLTRISPASAPGSPCSTGFSVAGWNGATGTGNGAVEIQLIPNTGYKLDLTSFTMALRRSGTGANGAFYYSVDNGSSWVAEGSTHAANTGGCGTVTSYTWTFGSTVTVTNNTYGIRFRVYGQAGSSGGNTQFMNGSVGGAVNVSNCSGTPATGTATAGTPNICTSGSSVVTLTGGTAGGGISYQWQASSDSATWSNVSGGSGATTTSYTTPTITSTTYYRCITTCSYSSASSNSNGAKVKVTSITGSPSNIAIATGAGATFTVNAAGAVSYQWQRSTTGTGGTYVNITSATLDATGTYSGYTTTSAATSNTLTLSSVPVGWNGYAYRCVVTSTCGNVTSSGATLSVTSAGCTGAPAAGTATAATANLCTSGSTTINLSGYTSGSGITYQWQSSPDSMTWTDISSATNLTYTTPILTTTTYYQCVTTCSTSSSSNISTGAKVTVTSITTSPTGSTISAGSGTTFTVTAAGAASYQWQRSTTGAGGTFVNITSGSFDATGTYSGYTTTSTATSNTLTLSSVPTSWDGYAYRCVVTNTCGSLTSGNAVLSVPCNGTPTAGTASAATPVICTSGSTGISLTGSATGSGLSYQWESSSDSSSWSSISGATNATYTTPTITTTTYYHCIITCSYSSLSNTTNGAKVQVNYLPSPGTITGASSLCVTSTAALSDTAAGGVWSSNNTAVATVNSSGVVTGVTSGIATISYTLTNGCGSTRATATETVYYYPAAVTVTPSTLSLCPTGPASALVASGAQVPYTTTVTSGTISVSAATSLAVGSSTLNISGIPSGATITGVAVTMNMSSTFQDDYVFNLTAPNSKTLNLINGRGNHGAGSYVNTIISSAGSAAFCNCSSTFTGTYAADLVGSAGSPAANITAWSGLYTTPNGNWTLSVYNNTTFTNSPTTLTSFTITISYTVPAPITWSPTTGLFSVADTSVSYSGAAATTVYARPYTTTSYVATATNGVCTTSDTATVNVSSSLAVSVITGRSVYCVGDTSTLSDSTAGGRWSTIDTFATVDSISGKVLALSAGTANITYTYTSGACSAYQTYTVTVNPLPVIGAISGAGSLCTGSSMSLSDTTLSGTWTSGTTTVATVSSSGVVTPVAQGATIISYTHSDGTCSNKATATVNVYNTPSAMTISPTSVTMCAGSSARLLTATGGISGGSPAFSNTGTYSFSHAVNVLSPVAVSGIPSGATITGVSVKFNASSAYDADEDFNLQAPNGNILNLAYLVGGASAAGFVNTVVSSAGSTSIASGAAPFTGTYAAQAVSGAGFSGYTSNVTSWSGLYSVPNGTWNLIGYHDYASGSASITSWTLTITYTVPSSVTWSAITGLYTNSGATTAYSGASSTTVYTLPTSTTVYTATSTNGGCSSSGTVSVTVLPMPTASVSGTTSICSGSSAVVSFTGDINDTVYYNVNSGTTQRIVLNGAGTASLTVSPTVTSVYNVTSVKSPAGCVTTITGSSATVMVNPLPAVSLGGSPSVCQPISTATISYSGATGSPTNYDITWGSSAITAGFSNVTGAGLSGGTISLAIPTAVTGSFTGTITVSNGSCASSSYSFSLGVLSHPTAAITSAPPICSGYSTNITFTGTSGADIAYSIDGGSTINTALTGGTYVLGTGVLTATHTYRLIDAHNAVCATSVDSTVTIVPTPMAWTGSTSSDWNDATNWSCGFVPGASDDATIPSGTTNSPVIAAAATGATRSLNIATGVTVTLSASAMLTVAGNLTNNGAVVGAGMLTMNHTTAQTVNGFGAVSNFDVNNTAGVTVNSGSRLTIKSVLSVTSGSLATGDSVVLYSDTFGSARVAVLPTGTSISGNVKVNQFFTGGRRAYRFWGHPFNNYIGLSQLENYVDVAGPGGSANGFTTTGSNQPSAYRYNPYVGNSSLAADPGWRPFASAYTTVDSNRLHQYQGIRVYYRGAKGEGLGFGPYVVISSTTASQWGVLNQGNQDVPLSRGTSISQDYNMIANPYASPVDIGTVIFNAAAAGRINGAYFYIWNPFLNTAGAFQAIPYSTGGGSPSAIPYYLQANDAFQIRAMHDGDLLNFGETNKGATVSNAYSLMKARNEYVSLYVYDANYHPYDMLYVNFNESATDEEDAQYDGGKPSGNDFTFYSLSADKHRLMVDARPYKSGSIIPLGLSSSYAQDYIIRAENLAVPEGGKVYLHDKLLKQYTLLQQGTEYRFSVTKDDASQGENRFELSMAPAEVKENGLARGLNVSMTPNPATDEVTVGFTQAQAENVTVRVLDISGACIYNECLGAKQSGSVKIQLNNVATGIYMVELTSGGQKVVQRLIKE